MKGLEHCIKEEHATDAIIRIANEDPGNVNILMIGPCTNLAMALLFEPTLKDKIGRVVVMGGTKNARGNVDINKEYNFNFDPEAAHIVMHTFP